MWWPAKAFDACSPTVATGLSLIHPAHGCSLPKKRCASAVPSRIPSTRRFLTPLSIEFVWCAIALPFLGFCGMQVDVWFSPQNPLVFPRPTYDSSKWGIPLRRSFGADLLWS